MDRILLIGTDIGTSGTKTIIMDSSGNLLAASSKTYDVLTPHALWAEQHAQIWYDAVIHTIQDALSSIDYRPEEIKGICISGLYGGSGVPLDKKMQPVRPCLIWMDRRATDESKWICESIGADYIYEITHNGTDAYYGYTKILWIKNHEPENWNRISMFLPPNAYVIYRLTGEIAIDYSSAGNIGGVFDAVNRTWSKPMMENLGIPVSMMPQRIVDSSDIVGGLTPAIANELGLLPDTPVCAGGVDCVVAMLGLGVTQAGTFAATIGTSMSAALICPAKESNHSNALIEMPYVKEPISLSYVFGGAATAGAIIKWFRDTFGELEFETEKNGGVSAYHQLDVAAARIAPGSDGLLVLPYFMGERSPIWDTEARGCILGLTLSHTKGHIYRAFLEAIAYSLFQLMESTNALNVQQVMMAGGVVKSKVWRQIFADVLGKEIICPKNDVEANIGDVLLAGIGTGVMTYNDFSSWHIFDEPVKPNGTAHQKYAKYYALYRKLYLDVQESMHQLSALAD